MSDNYVCESCVKEPIGTINVLRVISKLDECFARNDMAEAGETLRYWESEAKKLNDENGLLSILNEELGYYRKTGDIERGMAAVDGAVELLKKRDATNSLSDATIYVNVATTLKAFGKATRALPYYQAAQDVFEKKGKAESYEFAALINNRALAFADLKMFSEAVNDFERAIDILKKIGGHDIEIAASLMNMAHAVFDGDNTAYEKVEGILDLCWDYINADGIKKDANYAAVISKCAPSFKYFKRELEAEALEEVAAEIYAEGKNERA